MHELDRSAFIAGVSLVLLIVLDSKVVALAAKAVGMNVVEAGIFYGKGVKRRIANLDWKLGFIPLGSYVQIRGMYRQEEETAKEGDFDRVSLAKRIGVLLVDKLMLGLLLFLALIALPGGDFGVELNGLLHFWIFVLGGSKDAGSFPFDLVGHGAFSAAAVLSWMLFVAILPIGGSKSQRLILELIGSPRLKANSMISSISMLAGLALVVFLVVRLYQYVHAVSGSEALGSWISFFAGMGATMLLVWVIFLLLGKPIAKEPATSPDTVTAGLPPGTPSP